jgi:hypothetical protein
VEGKEDLNPEQIGDHDTDEALEREQTLIKSRRIAKVMESIRYPTIDPRLAKAMEQFRSPQIDPQLAKAMEQFRSPQIDPQLAKAMEQFRSPQIDPQLAKAMEQFRSPQIAPQLAKAMEQFRSPQIDPQLAKVMEQFRSPQIAPQLAKAMEHFRSPLMDPQLAKVMEQFRSPLMDPQLAKVMEQFSSVLQDNSIGKFVEQYRSALGHTRLGKLLQNSHSEARSALAGSSAAALLQELKSRRADSIDERDYDAERFPQSIEAEGHATATSTATGDARVEKPNTQNTPVKSQDLSNIPTWFIRFVLHLLLHSIELLGQWEQIRESVVDINARLPQTESHSKIRNFIRTELSGKPGDIRLVTGSEVNLRVDPSMKSDIIITLPKNTIVVVQGKEDRTWLLVSYELQGYWIDGYISTKYLKKIRKN